MTIDISAIPQGIATSMNVPLVAAQLICVAALMLMFVMPFVIMTKGKNLFAFIIPALLVLGISIALQWLSYWFLIIVCAIVALMFASHWLKG